MLYVNKKFVPFFDNFFQMKDSILARLKFIQKVIIQSFKLQYQRVLVEIWPLADLKTKYVIINYNII